MEWRNIYRGMLMGASDLVPGVSGGTIALLLGIYDDLIAAINHFLSKDWKKQLGFLIPLGVGLGMALLLLSHVIDWLLEHYPMPLQFFFLGLILGILPYLFKQANASRSFRFKHVVLLVIGVVLIGSIDFIDTTEGAFIESRTLTTYAYLFMSGFVASAAMVLPGISGSMILLVIGSYKTIIKGLKLFQLDVLLVVGIGVLIGIFVMSRLIRFFLEHFRSGTFAVVIGFVIGSLIIVFPGWADSSAIMVMSIAAFAIGLLAAFVLSRLEYKTET